MPELSAMKPADQLRRLILLATKGGWDIETAEGGGYTKVWFNGLRTTEPRHAADLKTGTFRAILKQLGLTEADLAV
jgi:hypothetical protein